MTKSPSKSKARRTLLAPLNPSPQYLRHVPDGIMNPEIGRSVFFAMDLLGWLGDNGIGARPTLIEIEAERAMFDGKAQARRNRARIVTATGGASAADFERVSDKIRSGLSAA